jgi:hypothetical protein
MRYINDITSRVDSYSKEQQDILLYAVNRNWGVPTFKIDNFVGGAQYSNFGKLRQFLLELKSREDNIVEYEFKIEKLQAEIELEKEFLEKTDSPAQKKIHNISIREKERSIYNTKNMVTMVYEERDKYMSLITKFNESEEGKMPDGRRYMDIIGNYEEEERLESELWATRLGGQAAYDLMFYGRINGGNLEAIYQLPEEVRMKALENAVEKTIITQKTLELVQKDVMNRLEIESSEKSNWAELDL